MVQQLRMENSHLGDQLAEQKLEVEELRVELHTLRRGLSAKLKRYMSSQATRTFIRIYPYKVHFISLVWVPGLD